MKIRSLPLFRIFVHGGALFPAAWLAFDYLTGRLSVNPIQDLTQRSGYYALILLVLAFSATPIYTLLKFKPALQVRRTLGLYAFLYAASHFLIFAGLDYTFDWDLILDAIVEKPFILVGASALLILLALAITSFNWWMKRLGKKWKRLHQLIYLATPLVIVHFTWARKGDLLRLQGDIWDPLAFGAVVGLLLIMRIPAVRKRLSRLRPAGKRTARPAFQEKPDPQ